MADEGSKASRTTSSQGRHRLLTLRTSLTCAGKLRTTYSIQEAISYVRKEPVLYMQDYGGEILKGFFNHGITMSTKDTVHATILRLYHTIRKILNQREISS